MTIKTRDLLATFGRPVIYGDDGLPVDDAFGFAGIRSRLGLNQAALARFCGIKITTVQNWEQGRSKPSTESLLVLADLLDTECQKKWEDVP